MVLAALIVLIVVCSIWFVVGKSEKENKKISTENFVKIKKDTEGNNIDG